MASIRQRGINSWQIIVSTGYNSEGKKLTKTKTVERPADLTDKKWNDELLKLSVEFERAIEQGIYYEPSKFMVSDFIIEWLDERGKDFENKTRYRYEGMLKGRITEALGRLKLEQVKPLHLLDFYRNLQECGIRDDVKYLASPELRGLIETQEMALDKFAAKADISERTLKDILSGKRTTVAKKICKALDAKLDKVFIPASEPAPLSSKTIQHYHRVLGIMFHDAVRWGLLRENPCSKVQPPKITQKEMKCLDEEGILKLFDALESEPVKYQALISLTLMTGCRRGEIAAIQWEHIDIENSVLYVKHAAEYTPETGIRIKHPKTPSSIRKIALPESTVQTLKQYHKWQLEEKVKLGELWQKEEKQGDAWKDPNWVFTTWDGYNIHPDSITGIFKKFRNRHNLPAIRLHDLRHTATTMLLHSGLNVRTVASRMGHANPNVTLAVYSHALQSADREAANIMENLKNKKTTQTKQA